NFGETIELYSDTGSLVSTITTPTQPSDLQQYLRMTEVMYHPANLSTAEQQAGYADPEQFEFIEVLNTGPATLDLTNVQLSKGIQFDFAQGSITSLAPGQYVLVASDPAALQFRYGGGLRIAGKYNGNLSNGGEPVE